MFANFANFDDAARRHSTRCKIDGSVSTSDIFKIHQRTHPCRPRQHLVACKSKPKQAILRNACPPIREEGRSRSDYQRLRLGRVPRMATLSLFHLQRNNYSSPTVWNSQNVTRERRSLRRTQGNSSEICTKLLNLDRQ